MNDYPVRLERQVRTESPQEVYLAVAAMLRADGYRILETEPIPAEASGQAFRGGFRAVRDTVLDAGRRRQGYVMMGVAAAMVVVMAVVYALELTDNRFLASAPLLPAVILGGLGLDRLKEPPRRIRRLVDTRFEGTAPGTVSLTLLAGVGQAEGDTAVSRWADTGDADAPVDADRLDRVLGRFRAA